MLEFIAIGLRALSFIAALQAAGTPIFLLLFGHELRRSNQVIRTMAARMTFAAVLLVLVQQVFEPTRLSGTLNGVTDRALQLLLLSSAAGTATAIRILGLIFIVAAVSKAGRLRDATGLIGAALVAVSFTYMGHTATADARWLLAGMLVVHLVVILFWFGALLPLYVVSRTENNRVAGSVIAQFSAQATRLVPCILIAGVAMAAMLLPDLSSVGTPYGIALLTKSVGFALLLPLAGLNKWRFGPSILRGESSASISFRFTLLAEWILIAAIIVVTTVMTAWFSPTH